MIYNIIYVILALVALFLVIVALLPPDFRIERRALISAPPATVYGQVISFQNWAAWSPWEKMDPDMKRTHQGPAAGPGSVYSWVGNKKVGEGRMTLTDARPNEMVRIKLEFLKPFAATNTIEFTFKGMGGQGGQGGQGQGEQTEVIWAMTGRKAFMMKAFCLFMNMDKMVGADFEKGLAQMKAVAEAA
jgi:hypothetical protein